MTAILSLQSEPTNVVRVEGALWMPVTRALRHNVRTLLLDRPRWIVLDLSGVSRIDAAGVGELVRAFNMTTTMNSRLRIVNATASVREMLERAHVFNLLSGDSEVERRLA